MIVQFISILTGQNHISSESLSIKIIEFVLICEMVIGLTSVAGKCLR